MKVGRIGTAITWTAQMDRLLGTVTDAAVAQQFDISEQAVRNRRTKLRIDATRPYNYWTRSMIAELRRRVARGQTHHEIADAMKLTYAAITSKCDKLDIRSPLAEHTQWTTEMDAVIGADSDRVVAGVLGVTDGAVKRRRDVLGIPPGLHTECHGPYRDPERLRGAQYARLYAAGKSGPDIAREFDVSAVVVYKELKRYRRARSREVSSSVPGS